MKTRRGLIKSFTLVLAVGLLASSAMAKSCLWKVTSGENTLYLQGSIHALRVGSYPLDPAIEKAYTACEVLVLEADIKEMSSAEIQVRIMTEAKLPQGKTLQNTLDETSYKQFSQACRDADIPMVIMDPFEPWYATMSLAMIKMQKMGFDPSYGLDIYFYDKATKDKKKVIGLETIDFQINLFSSLSKEDPNELVSRALADLKLFKEDVEKMEKAWKGGDIEALGELLDKSFEGYPESYKRFILDRNASWIKTFDTLLEKPETHMVVVGAGHLPGKGGLLELLKKKGCTLEQL